MAASESKFSHITVTTDDEDDVVIEAGARTPEPAAEAARPAEEPRSEPAAVEAAARPARAERAAADDAEERAGEEPSASKPKRDDYRETTIDDLKSAPMSATQKIILALAAVGVLAIVAYCLFMR